MLAGRRPGSAVPGAGDKVEGSRDDLEQKRATTQSSDLDACAETYLATGHNQR